MKRGKEKINTNLLIDTGFICHPKMIDKLLTTYQELYNEPENGNIPRRYFTKTWFSLGNDSAKEFSCAGKMALVACFFRIKFSIH